MYLGTEIHVAACSRLELSRRMALCISTWNKLDLLWRKSNTPTINKIQVYDSIIRNKLVTDVQFRDFFEGETDEIPQFFIDIIRRDLGILWKWLPEGALHHNPNAYLEKMELSSSM